MQNLSVLVVKPKPSLWNIPLRLFACSVSNPKTNHSKNIKTNVKVVRVIRNWWTNYQVKELKVKGHVCCRTVMICSAVLTGQTSVMNGQTDIRAYTMRRAIEIAEFYFSTGHTYVSLYLLHFKKSSAGLRKSH